MTDLAKETLNDVLTRLENAKEQAYLNFLKAKDDYEKIVSLYESTRKLLANEVPTETPKEPIPTDSPNPIEVPRKPRYLDLDFTAVTDSIVTVARIKKSKVLSLSQIKEELSNLYGNDYLTFTNVAAHYAQNHNMTSEECTEIFKDFIHSVA